MNKKKELTFSDLKVGDEFTYLYPRIKAQRTGFKVTNIYETRIEYCYAFVAFSTDTFTVNRIFFNTAVRLLTPAEQEARKLLPSEKDIKKIKPKQFLRDAVIKKMDGISLSEAEKIELMLFQRAFGNCAPMSKNEFLANSDNEDKDYALYLFGHKQNINAKIRMIEGARHIFFLNYFYKAGAIIMHGKDHPLYPDTLIVVINDDGEEKENSEALNIQLSTRFVDHRFHLTKKANVYGATIIQHLCSNPDCRNCSPDRDKDTEDLPYQILIETTSHGMPIYVGSFDLAARAVEVIFAWLYDINTLPENIQKP